MMKLFRSMKLNGFFLSQSRKSSETNWKEGGACRRQRTMLRKDGYYSITVECEGCLFVIKTTNSFVQ
jgi:hypothetical protein